MVLLLKTETAEWHDVQDVEEMFELGRIQEHCFAERCQYHDDFERGLLNVFVGYEASVPVLFAVVIGTTLVEVGSKHSAPPPPRHVNATLALIHSNNIEEVWDIDGNIHRAGIVNVNGEWMNILKLPSDLIVNHSLNLNNIHVLHSLPTNLTIRGDLSICKTQIGSLPTGLVVEGNIDKRYTVIHDA